MKAQNGEATAGQCVVVNTRMDRASTDVDLVRLQMLQDLTPPSETFFIFTQRSVRGEVEEEFKPVNEFWCL